MLIGLLSTPAWAIECGDVLGPGGQYTLTGDLECFEHETPTLTARDGAGLDLAGHQLLNLTVTLAGSQTAIRNGGIAHLDLPLVITGTGGHAVERITIGGTFPSTAIRVDSPGNVIQTATSQTAWRASTCGATGTCSGGIR